MQLLINIATIFRLYDVALENSIQKLQVFDNFVRKPPSCHVGVRKMWGLGTVGTSAVASERAHAWRWRSSNKVLAECRAGTAFKQIMSLIRCVPMYGASCDVDSMSMGLRRYQIDAEPGELATDSQRSKTGNGSEGVSAFLARCGFLATPPQRPGNGYYSDKHIKYRIELVLSAMENGLSGQFSVAERLSRLRTYQDAWRQLQPSSTVTWDFNIIHFVAPSSGSVPAYTRQGVNALYGCINWDLHLEGIQPIRIHLQSIRTGDYHPLASEPIFVPGPETLGVPVRRKLVDIHGDFLALNFDYVHSPSRTIIILNWKTGIVHLGIDLCGGPDLVSYDYQEEGPIQNYAEQSCASARSASPMILHYIEKAKTIDPQINKTASENDPTFKWDEWGTHAFMLRTHGTRQHAIFGTKLLLYHGSSKSVHGYGFNQRYIRFPLSRNTLEEINSQVTRQIGATYPGDFVEMFNDPITPRLLCLRTVLRPPRLEDTSKGLALDMSEDVLILLPRALIILIAFRTKRDTVPDTLSRLSEECARQESTIAPRKRACCDAEVIRDSSSCVRQGLPFSPSNVSARNVAGREVPISREHIVESRLTEIQQWRVPQNFGEEESLTESAGHQKAHLH
ncbi:hypothetical protein OBBRIDRAFT_807024 [Obba rivulosa]|uniref:Uncharacterized protein n=1 Tax=Obba rivulosa TaxID=1052685 RepID=A0A8E2AQ83_9APHY|nr:hypothetical protein OBBRIDRAFT_807024 [Obba rivulosa]